MCGRYQALLGVVEVGRRKMTLFALNMRQVKSARRCRFFRSGLEGAYSPRGEIGRKDAYSAIAHSTRLTLRAEMYRASSKATPSRSSACSTRMNDRTTRRRLLKVLLPRLL